MVTMEELRVKFPQYNDLSDEQLLRGVHRKYYGDMTYDDFYSNFGQTKEQMFQEQVNAELQKSAQETPWYEAALVGAGKEFVNLGRGIRQLFSGDEKDAEIQALAEEEARLLAPLEEERPISTTIGGMAPYLALGGLGAGTRAVQAGMKAHPVLTGAALGGAEGAAIGGLHPLQTAAEGAAGGALGGGLGGGLGSLLSRRPPGQLTAGEKQAVEWGEEMGMKFMPGARTGVPELQRLDASLANNPNTAGPVEALSRRNADVLTQQALKPTGISAQNVTTDMLEDHMLDLSKEYGEMIAKTSGKLDIPLWDAAEGAIDEVIRLEGKSSPVLDRFFRRIKTSAGPKFKISGDDMQSIYSDLSQVIRNRAKSTNPKAIAEREQLIQLRNAIDNNIERYMGGDVLADWKNLRRKYAATKLILENDVLKDVSAQGGLKQLGAGHINPTKLATALKKQNRQQYNMASGPFEDMVKAARVGRYIESQPGPGLKVPHALTAAVGTGLSKKLPQLLFTGGTRLGGVDDFMLALYRMGWPHVTGLTGLPSRTKDVLSQVGKAYGIQEYEDE